MLGSRAEAGFPVMWSGGAAYVCGSALGYNEGGDWSHVWREK